MSSSISDKDNGSKDLLKALKGAAITVGIHEQEGSAKKEGTEGDLTLAEVASMHEFGIGTPQRSFIGGFVDEDETRLIDALRKIAQVAEQKHQSVEQALSRFGLWVVGRIQQRIADGIPPELSARRLAEKEALSGVAKETPLIFTGQLRSSIRSQVDKNGDAT